MGEILVALPTSEVNGRKILIAVSNINYLMLHSLVLICRRLSNGGLQFMIRYSKHINIKRARINSIIEMPIIYLFSKHMVKILISRFGHYLVISSSNKIFIIGILFKAHSTLSFINKIWFLPQPNADNHRLQCIWRRLFLVHTFAIGNSFTLLFDTAYIFLARL